MLAWRTSCERRCDVHDYHHDRTQTNSNRTEGFAKGFEKVVISTLTIVHNSLLECSSQEVNVYNKCQALLEIGVQNYLFFAIRPSNPPSDGLELVSNALVCPGFVARFEKWWLVGVPGAKNSQVWELDSCHSLTSVGQFCQDDGL